LARVWSACTPPCAWHRARAGLPERPGSWRGVCLALY